MSLFYWWSRGMNKHMRAILLILQSGDALFGSDIVQQNPFLHLGSIYVYLGRLENLGYVRSVKLSTDTEAKTNPSHWSHKITLAHPIPARRLYSITQKGIDVLYEGNKR